MSRRKSPRSDIRLETATGVILRMPGSAGRYEGPVRCLENPESGDTLEPGEVLETPQANAGWTTDIPRPGAVVNGGDATRRPATGDRVLVDGVKGKVRILARVEAGS